MPSLIVRSELSKHDTVLPKTPKSYASVLALLSLQPLRRNAMSQAFIRPWAVLCIVLGMTTYHSAAIAAEPAMTETIILIRHGEKPNLGLGQLNCQGLNRALALPAVIRKDFGKPDLIIAPNPGETKSDSGQSYHYVRPLATIEPTAIAFGLPVDAGIGVSNIDALRRKLEGPAYRSSLVLIAWEHNLIVKLARILMTGHGGNAAMVPAWNATDFDSIYVIRITRTGSASAASFEHLQENLNGLSSTCPGQEPG